MKKIVKQMSVMLVLVLFVSVFATFTALAASEKRFDLKNGNYVTISNVVETKTIKDSGYGVTAYVVTAPVTITFHGEFSEETRIAEWVDSESLDYVPIKDNMAVLTEEAQLGYGIFPVLKGETRDTVGFNNAILLQVVAGTGGTQQPPAPPVTNANPVSATPTPSKVIVNSKNVSFEAYEINNSNYFKLRDLAFAVNGSEKNFEVSWDAANNAIALLSNKAYTPAGNELVSSGGKASQQVTETTAKVMLDGKEVKITAYEIDGSNYFKLRDVAKLMNIGVTWDENAGSIGIDTKVAYTE